MAADRRSSTPGGLTRRSLLGLVLAALGAVAFVAQADAVREGDGLAAFDPKLTTNVVAHRTVWPSNIATAITSLGSVPVLTGLTVVIAVLLRVFTRRWQPALVLVITARATKLAGTTAALALTVAIGFSRIYLGYHWQPTSSQAGRSH
jgi:membrane-associated phospholipid phosphatase